MAKCIHCGKKFEHGETRYKTEDNCNKIWTLCKHCNNELSVKWHNEYQKLSEQWSTKQRETATKICKYLITRNIPVVGYSCIDFRKSNVVNIRIEINEKQELDDCYKKMKPLIEELMREGIKIQNFSIEVGTVYIGEKNNELTRDVSYLDLGIEID